MSTKTRKLVTIVTESALEQSLIDDFNKLGVRGYTITNARGKGHRGARDADWSTSGNIRIEIVCGNKVADAIVKHLKEHYYKDYAMILFMHDVDVMRREKF